MNLITAIFKSITAIFTGTFWINSFKCIFFTIISLIAFIWIIGTTLSSFTFFEDSWIQALFIFFYFGGSSVVAWLLFPAILPLIASLFQHGLLNNLEKNEYEQEEPVKSHSKISSDILFALKVIGINSILLPLLIFPPLYFFLYYIANGHMLGTEFFRIITDRRIEREISQKLIARNKITVYGAGMLITFFANIPIINLILPLVAVILMMHIFYIIQADGN